MGARRDLRGEGPGDRAGRKRSDAPAWRPLRNAFAAELRFLHVSAAADGSAIRLRPRRRVDVLTLLLIAFCILGAADAWTHLSRPDAWPPDSSDLGALVFGSIFGGLALCFIPLELDVIRRRRPVLELRGDRLILDWPFARLELPLAACATIYVAVMRSPMFWSNRCRVDLFATAPDGTTALLWAPMTVFVAKDEEAQALTRALQRFADAVPPPGDQAARAALIDAARAAGRRFYWRRMSALGGCWLAATLVMVAPLPLRMFGLW